MNLPATVTILVAALYALAVQLDRLAAAVTAVG